MSTAETYYWGASRHGHTYHLDRDCSQLQCADAVESGAEPPADHRECAYCGDGISATKIRSEVAD
jgi:hypothetical protein